MNFNFFRRKRYNISTLPDISRINLNLFFREFESNLLTRMSELDLANHTAGLNNRVAAVINHAKEIAMSSATEAITQAYRPK